IPRRKATRCGDSVETRMVAHPSLGARLKRRLTRQSPLCGFASVEPRRISALLLLWQFWPGLALNLAQFAENRDTDCTKERGGKGKHEQSSKNKGRRHEDVACSS